MEEENQNFDYRDYSEDDLFQRFPVWVRGFEPWGAFSETINYDSFNSLRNFGIAQKSEHRLSCPRVFISHRQNDEKYAERIAYLANQNGFYYWLDVHDKNLERVQHLNLSDKQKSLLIGAIIEMAIMNCTHVIAVMTENTQGSMWVPYEYGRIVDLPQNSSRASCWLNRDIGYVPEYLNFGKIHLTENQIIDWFNNESQSYLNYYQLNAGQCNPEWNGDDEPASLN